LVYAGCIFHSAGGAADVCELIAGDEILAINGALLANHYLESVKMVIDQAVTSGLVDLTVRRLASGQFMGYFNEYYVKIKSGHLLIILRRLVVEILHCVTSIK